MNQSIENDILKSEFICNQTPKNSDIEDLTDEQITSTIRYHIQNNYSSMAEERYNKFLAEAKKRSIILQLGRRNRIE